MTATHYDPSKYQSMGVFNQSAKKERWDKDIPWHEMRPGWNHFRIMGPYFRVAHHWFETPKGKRFSLLCPEFDPFTGNYSNVGQCSIEEEFGNCREHTVEKIKTLAPRLSSYVQVIVRELQQQGDPYPVRPLRLPITTLSAIRKQAQLNLDGNNQPIDVNDPQYGCDLMINYDPHGQGAERYSVTLAQGGKIPLSEVEMSYFQNPKFIIWENIIEYPGKADIKEALSRNGYYSAAGGAQDAANVTNVNVGPTSQASTVQAPIPAGPQAPTPAYQAPQAPAYQAPQAPAYQAPQAAPVAPQAPQAPQAAPVAPQAPQAPQAAPVEAAPVAPQAPQASNEVQATGATEFSLVGRQDKVGKPEFEAAILEYGNSLKTKGVSRGFNGTGQLKVWEKDDLAGVQVLDCFASYRGDNDCIRCPLRKQCLIY